MMLLKALLTCLFMEEKREPRDLVKEGEEVKLVTRIVSTPSMVRRLVSLSRLRRGEVPRSLVRVVAPCGRLGWMGGAVPGRTLSPPVGGASTSDRSFLGCKHTDRRGA